VRVADRGGRGEVDSDVPGHLQRLGERLSGEDQHVRPVLHPALVKGPIITGYGGYRAQWVVIVFPRGSDGRRLGIEPTVSSEVETEGLGGGRPAVGGAPDVARGLRIADVAHHVIPHRRLAGWSGRFAGE